MSNRKFNKQNRANQTSGIREDFYKRLFYIALCIIPLLIFADTKGTFRLLPLAFFLIGMYQVIQIIALSQLIIDDFFPPKLNFEKTVKPFDKFVYHFSSTLFFVGLLCQIFEIRNFDNTINGTKFFWIAAIIGILLAIILTVVLKTKFPSVYFESKRRYTVHFGLFLGFFLIIPAILGFINHHFADINKNCKHYLITRKGIGGSRSKEYFINITLENNIEERFSIGKTRYDNFEEGERIELCTVKGKLGFDYVTEFNKVDQ